MSERFLYLTTTGRTSGLPRTIEIWFVQRGERPLAELLQPMTAFLVPVFFVLVGFRTNVRVLLNPALLTFAAALSVAAIVGKLACGLGVLTRGARRLSDP